MAADLIYFIGHFRFLLAFGKWQVLILDAVCLWFVFCEMGNNVNTSVNLSSSQIEPTPNIGFGGNSSLWMFVWMCVYECVCVSECEYTSCALGKSCFWVTMSGNRACGDGCGKGEQFGLQNDPQGNIQADFMSELLLTCRLVNLREQSSCEVKTGQHCPIPQSHPQEGSCHLKGHARPWSTHTHAFTYYFTLLLCKLWVWILFIKILKIDKITVSASDTLHYK